MKGKKTAGAIGGGLLSIIASAANVNAGRLEITNTSSVDHPDITLVHHTQGQEGGDDVDVPYNFNRPTPVIHFYTETDITPPLDYLKQEGRNDESMTTFEAKLAGEALPTSTSAELSFGITDAWGEYNFAGKNIIGVLCEPDNTVISQYDVKAMDNSGGIIPITVNNGLSKKLNVEFYASADLNIDGNVNLVDYAILAKNWMRTGVVRGDVYNSDNASDITGPAGIPDGKVNFYDLDAMASSSQWLYEKPE